jgi:hypothetical protein
LRIVYRNFPDDAGIDFLVTSDLGGTAIAIAAVEGHFRGPGLCWAELQALAGMPDPVHSPTQRLVLALPSLGDTGRPADAVTVVTDALRSIGAVGDAGALAAELIESPTMFGHATWAIRQGVRMCLGRHAVRHVQDLSLNHLREVDLAFGGRYYRSRSGSSEYRHGAVGRTLPRWRYEVTESRTVLGVGMRLRGRLDGEVRDGEPALLRDGASSVAVGAIRLEFEDTSTGQLVITIPDTGLALPAPGATLHPSDDHITGES